MGVATPTPSSLLCGGCAATQKMRNDSIESDKLDFSIRTCKAVGYSQASTVGAKK